MVTFLGYAVPGSLFILFGLWCVFQSFRRFFNCRQRNTRFTSSVVFPCDCLCGRLKDLPVEGGLKILAVLIGIAGELGTAVNKPHVVLLNNSQHASVFFFFGISGVVDILVHYHAPLPPDIDYATVVLAFMVEALLFYFNLHDRTELDMMLHTLLVYTVLANAAAVAMEMKYRNSLLGPLARAYVLLIQGTWFWHIGFIMNNPFPGVVSWKEDGNAELVVASLFYVWHCAVDFIIILMIGASIACCYRRQANYSQDEGVGMKRLIHTGANGQTLVALNDDSDLDSDIEFQKPLSNK